MSGMHASSAVDCIDRITIGGVMVSMHASSAVDCMDRITIGGVMVSVHASSAVDRMDRITIGGVMVRRANFKCSKSYGPHHHRWCNC
jgi:type IV secretory pathway ATPase VirB11/archaellum biosynthesis ATPase